MPSAGTQ